MEALAPERSVVWLAVPHQGCRSMAPEEGTLIADLLMALHDGAIKWSDMGVVVPFRRQARYIRQRLGARQPDRVSPPALTIDTVERMQGQEREVIVISFTTSDEDFAHRLKDFLFLPQRLNVAATRPRSKLILVASSALLEFAEKQLDDEGSACFASLLKSAHRIDIALPPTAK
jgi:DNA replication ATP-dependent helicase Dna2